VARLPVVCLLIVALSASGQDTVPQVSVEPLAKMQALSALAGDWELTVYATSDGGETWQPTPAQPVTLRFGHKGFMLEEIPADLDSPGFHMHTIITYDQYRGVYRKAALDDVWGILDLYEGSVIDDRLVLDNLESGTFFPLEDGTWRGFRLTMELKAGHRWMWIDKTDDRGATWQPAFKSEYRRVAD
jgi:hypothetical protein